jgi:uncharacterized membrane protein YjfL (UPF0719 family)
MSAAIDTLASRNNTAVTITLGGQRVGRVQQFRSSQANNVQVIAELGRDYMVEMAKGLTVFSFSISTFYVRNDLFDTIRNGQTFGLVITDGAGVAEVLDAFDQCMLQSVDRSYAAGAVTVGQDAAVVAIGKGKLGLT